MGGAGGGGAGGGGDSGFSGYGEPSEEGVGPPVSFGDPVVSNSGPGEAEGFGLSSVLGGKTTGGKVAGMLAALIGMLSGMPLASLGAGIIGAHVGDIAQGVITTGGGSGSAVAGPQGTTSPAVSLGTAGLATGGTPEVKTLTPETLGGEKTKLIGKEPNPTIEPITRGRRRRPNFLEQAESWLYQAGQPKTLFGE